MCVFRRLSSAAKSRSPAGPPKHGRLRAGSCCARLLIQRGCVAEQRLWVYGLLSADPGNRLLLFFCYFFVNVEAPQLLTELHSTEL
jgi:hypothetical protein